MSWKLAKKLKETHLGASTNFPWSSSSVDRQSGTSGTGIAETTNTVTSNTAPTATPPDTLVGPSNEQHPVHEAPKPGILVLTLYEARGLTLPEQYRDVFVPQQRNNPRPGHSDAAPLSLTSRAPATFSPKSNRPQTSGERGSSGIPEIHGRVPARYMPYALVDFDKVQVFINSVEGNFENPLWAGSSTQYKFDVSRAAELTVHLFVRNPKSKPSSGRSEDILLGVVRLNPRLEPRETSNQSATRNNKKERDQDNGFTGVEWVNIQQGTGTGKLQLGVDFVQDQASKLSINDFELLKVVGKGSFGKVMQVLKKDTNRIYALKTIRKARLYHVPKLPIP